MKDIDLSSIDQDTRAGLASVLEDVSVGLAEVYGFDVDEIKQRLVTADQVPDGLFAIFGLLYAIQGFLLDPSDEGAVGYLTAAALAIEPVVYQAVGIEASDDSPLLDN